MSRFRELVKSDVTSVFLDPEVFADPHEVDGKTVMGVVVHVSSDPSQEAKGLGVYRSGVVLYVDERDLEREPEGEPMNLDGRLYTITRWQVEMGMHRITLGLPLSY